jgi:tetratricopeptide (TPR) repeat protein
MPRFTLIALALALLTACAGQPAEPEQTTSPPAPEPPAAPPPERPFPEDSFYDLLVAEFALRRRDYDIAVERYMAQSDVLRDPAVSAHTTHITQYLRRDEEMLRAAELWVALEPDNMEARNTLAGALVRQGRSTEALPHLTVIERQGEVANFPLVLADFDTLDERQRAELVTAINALSSEFPDSVQLLLTQALLHAELGQDELALERLDELLALEPAQPQALLLEARIRSERGDRRPYARIDKALRDDPDNQLLRLRYARLLTATDMRAAREQFEILSARAPQDGDLLFTLALLNREIGDPVTASAYLRQLLELGQRVNEAHYYLGRIEEERENPERALFHYQSVAPGEEYMPANGRIGELLLSMDDDERARGWFDQQRLQHPQLRQQLFGLEAELLSQAGRSDAALALLNDALAESPGSSTLLYARAMLFVKRNDVAAMEADLRTILAEDPDNATALNALGYTLADRTDRFDEALQLVSRALELEPAEPAILDSMGWVLYRLGDREGALTYLRRAYGEFPDPEVAAHLGEVLWMTGQRDEALAIWREAWLADPDHGVLGDTLQRLGIDTALLADPQEATGR